MIGNVPHPVAAGSNTNEVLFVLCVNNLGGGELSMFSIARGLKQAGYNVVMAVYGARPDLASEAELGMPVIRLSALRTMQLFGPLYRLLRQRKPPVLITALTHTNAICIAAATFAGCGTRVIATEHSPVLLDPRTLTNRKDKILCRIIGPIYRHAEEVVAVSKGLATYIRAMLGGDQAVRVIYNPVLTDNPMQSAAAHPWLSHDKTPIIMGAGRFSQEKNFALLVKAFAEVRKKHPVRLVLLGEGEERVYIQSLIDRLGLRDNVLLPGFVTNMKAWLGQATVFVSPSHIEGFGNAIVEAMACGVPVISTDCPFGPAEILQDGRFGCLVPVNNVAAMQQAIEDVLANPPDTQAARQRAEAFTATRCYQTYARLIDEILARPPASLLRRLRQKIASIVLHENWMMGIVRQPLAQSLQWTSCPPVEWIGQRSNSGYYADPFSCPDKPQTMLCEYYDFVTRTGSLREVRLANTSIAEDRDAALPLTGHLSFPFMFEDEGVVYALPESSSLRKLALFKRAQKDWQEIATPLQDIAAADSILFRHNGLYWIAYTDVDLGPFDNLNLCYAPALTGPWQSHAANPVKCDRRSSRCAGPVFATQGKLYRAAQDCSQTYGGSIRIMEITNCTPTAFAEQEVTHIQPEQGINPHGLHTLTNYGDVACLVDGKRMMFSPEQLFAKITRRIKRSLKM